MKRAILMVSGVFLAGVYALIMYAIYGNLNWGGAAYKAVPWFEPVFWLIAGSGVLLVLAGDLRRAVSRRPDCSGRAAACGAGSQV